MISVCHRLDSQVLRHLKSYILGLCGVTMVPSMQVWRLLAQLVHEPDKRMPGSGLALRRAGETASGGNSFSLLATQLMNLTSPGMARPAFTTTKTLSLYKDPHSQPCSVLACTSQ